MGETNRGHNGKGPSSDRHASGRHEVNLPVVVKIGRSVMTQPFQIKDVLVRDVGYAGSVLSLTIEARTTREELSKMLVRRRTCSTLCQFPGADRPCWMFGEIVWVEPRVTSHGIQVRFGVNLDESKPETLADVKAFLKSQEAEK